MDYKLLIDTAVLAGVIMLENGAEISRVEGTINHILGVSGLKITQAFVTSTGLIVTLDDPSIDSLTVVRRVQDRVTNLSKIDMTNTVSRQLCAGEISLKDAFHHLKYIKQGHAGEYPRKVRVAAVIVVVAGFSVMFGATGVEAALAGAVGGLLSLTMFLLEKLRVNAFIQNLILAMTVAIGTILVSGIPRVNININPVIIGAIMPIVPGAAITNAIRDTLHGDYTAGGAKVLEAFVTAAAIAIGVGFGFLLTGGLGL